MNKKLVGILKIITTLILIFIVVHKIGVKHISGNLDKLWHIEVLMAMFMSPIVVLLGVYKWKLLVNGSGFKATWKSFATSYLGGMGIGLFTPMRVGELSRILFLSGNREVLLGVALLDKAIDLQVLLLLSTIGCLIVFGMKMAVIFGGSSILLLSIIMFPILYNPVKKKMLMLPFKEKLERLFISVEDLPYSLKNLCLLIRLFVCGINIVQFGLLLNAFQPVSFLVVFSVLPIIVLISNFPITIGGLGLREGVAALMLNSFGVSPAIAVTASFSLFCVNNLLPGAIGFIFLSNHSVNSAKDMFLNKLKR
jgi:uncharacterized membrane protein YbhN (UPF0104 family)